MFIDFSLVLMGFQGVSCLTSRMYFCLEFSAACWIDLLNEDSMGNVATPRVSFVIEGSHELACFSFAIFFFVKS